MKKFKIKVQGMTCSSCEEHLAEVLENMGAENIEASFHRGEIVFELPGDVTIESAKMAIDETKYQPGEIEEALLQENVVLGNDGEGDLLIIGSGGAAFSAAIKAIEYGAKVGMIERGTVGGTCVYFGCVPSKALLRAGEINHLAKINPFAGLKTSAQGVELAPLVKQKDELVNRLRNQKYVSLIDEYGFDLIEGEGKFAEANNVEVNGNTLSAKRFLIATGASFW